MKSLFGLVIGFVNIECSANVLSQDNIGLKQYEISNFGKPSVHNYGYWEYDEYLGVGAGAVARIKNNRYYPIKDIKDYIQNPLYTKIEKLSENDIIIEKILLGFRCNIGVDSAILSTKQIKRLNVLSQQNLVSLKNNRYYNNNYLLADEIALNII